VAGYSPLLCLRGKIKIPVNPIGFNLSFISYQFSGQESQPRFNHHVAAPCSGPASPAALALSLPQAAVISGRNKPQ
jgi:hypothetical protein